MNIKVPAIFRNHQFLRLWGNQILLQVAFNMCNYTALLIIADRTHSPFAQAQLYAALTLPAFVFGLIAGPIVDITDKKHLMIITDAALAILFVLYAFVSPHVVLIMIVAFLTSSVARFFIPAEAATIPLIVDENTLHHANTFFLFTLMGSVLLGYAVAGPIIQAFGGLRTSGELMPFFLSGALVIIGLILRLTLKKIEGVRPAIPSGGVFKKTFGLFWETVSEVRKNHSVSLSLGLLVFVEFMVGASSILLLEYVRRYLLLPLPSISYVLMLPLITGLILGAVFLDKIEKIYGQRKSILLSCLGTGAVFAIFGTAPFIFQSPAPVRTVAIAAAFLMGIFLVLIAVQSRTILQVNTKSEMHGRIFSFLDIMIALITPVPVLVLGFLADKVSILWMLSVIGISIIAISVLSGKFARR